ncbi:hypothetical protein [uncultured Nocardioides sp.]|jgi:hypothetical protein|uniref:hypothetical protein n=1 Tax=uncultured Nocardioides sp. TaxID=198441 RepID=UPI000C568829|nr:hypothetical protein [uncultured Nocardioides sp.]MAO81661.1 hypothetical protein [Nocardioides sp.]
MSSTPPPYPPGEPGGSGPDYGQTPPPPPPPPGGGYGGGYGTPPPSGPPAGGGYGGGYGGAPSPQWSVGDAVSFGWRTFKANVGPILLAILVLLVVNGALQALGSAFGDNIPLTLAFGVLGWVVGTVLSAGVVRGALDLAEGRGIRQDFIMALFQPPKLPQVLLLGLLQGVIVTVGLILCVLPGLVAIVLTAFSVYFLVDRPDLDAIGSLKASVSLVTGNLGSVLLWMLTCLGLAIAGTLACLVGLLAALPVIYLGTAFTYKRLTGQPVAG